MAKIKMPANVVDEELLRAAWNEFDAGMKKSFPARAWYYVKTPIVIMRMTWNRHKAELASIVISAISLCLSLLSIALAIAQR